VQISRHASPASFGHAHYPAGASAPSYPYGQLAAYPDVDYENGDNGGPSRQPKTHHHLLYHSNTGHQSPAPIPRLTQNPHGHVFPTTASSIGLSQHSQPQHAHQHTSHDHLSRSNSGGPSPSVFARREGRTVPTSSDIFDNRRQKEKDVNVRDREREREREREKEMKVELLQTGRPLSLWPVGMPGVGRPGYDHIQVHARERERERETVQQRALGQENGGQNHVLKAAQSNGNHGAYTSASTPLSALGTQGGQAQSQSHVHHPHIPHGSRSPHTLNPAEKRAGPGEPKNLSDRYPNLASYFARSTTGNSGSGMGMSGGLSRQGSPIALQPASGGGRASPEKASNAGAMNGSLSGGQAGAGTGILGSTLGGE
jgi:hypothetical protein